MEPEKKRSYTSGTRDAQAARTKNRILEAARALFQKEGFDLVTINKIASAAEVSVPTVYALFKSKRGILQALIDQALPPEQFALLVNDSMQEASLKKCLAVTAKLARRMYDAEREFFDLLRGVSGIAPELQQLEREREQRRYERQEEYAKKIAAHNKKLSLEMVRDVLWVLTSRDIYRMCVLERGWSSDQYESWLTSLFMSHFEKEQ